MDAQAQNALTCLLTCPLTWHLTCPSGGIIERGKDLPVKSMPRLLTQTAIGAFVANPDTMLQGFIK